MTRTMQVIFIIAEHAGTDHVFQGIHGRAAQAQKGVGEIGEERRVNG